jgi:hypothetical protein
MSDTPVELDFHRGMAAQKATDLRRVVADAEAHAASLRARELQIESLMLAEHAANWPEAAAKARYVLNLYNATLIVNDTRRRDLVAAVLADFARLSLDES